MLPVPINDPNLQTFIDRLMADKLVACSSPLNAPLPGDGVHFAVNKIKVKGYEPLRCHHNCRVHKLRHQGNVIYGWNLYSGVIEGNHVYVAQHHAIWENNGQFADVTPEYDEQIRHVQSFTFLPDNRVPIGHIVTFKIPSLFIYCAGMYCWASGLSDDSRFSKDYFETIATSSDFAIQALNLSSR
ncbi:hypothetical protein CXQ82_15660 [Pseudomonas sp. S09G 359]|jgi:hypothetical protein|nr:hypothetical protein CXQ82_15660 [Pseudomonas sp. S09G 359]